MAQYTNSTGEPLAVQEERKQYGKEKPKAKDTARLIWASKPRREPSAKDLEFQTAEEVYPNIVDLEDKKLSSFVPEEKEISEQPNRLIWGDNLLVMQALLAQGYEGQIDLIYIDPPFNTGENFNFKNEIKIGEKEYEKELPIAERLTYTDTWSRGKDSFLDMLYPRLQLLHKLLSDNGSFFIHVDVKIGPYVRILLDELFGEANFQNEIIWYYYNKLHDSRKKILPKAFDVICYYVKNKKSDYTYHRLEEKRDKPVKKLRYKKVGGVIQNVRGEDGKVETYVRDMRTVDNVWRLRCLQPANKKEWIDFATQKPVDLIEKILRLASNEGDLVLDVFDGTGTTAIACERQKRRWILSDISKTAIQITRSRLVKENSNPFIIQNLGNYQRQLIYAREIKIKEMYDIILKIYGATPRKDWHGFGISKDDKKTIVYVCEPDRPMTGKKAIELAKAAKTADGKGYKKLVILAWDYEYDFDDIYKRLAKSARKGVVKDVEFKIIPSDVYKYLRSTKVGDQELANKITFYQKPYLRLSEPQTKSINPNEVKVEIKIERYVVMDIPVKDESKRPEIEKLLHKNFANMIDYWTVDWDYNGEVFRSTWQAIKDRKSPEPVPVLADTVLKKGKKYTIAVRVVDVFGNDASMTKEINLR